MLLGHLLARLGIVFCRPEGVGTFCAVGVAVLGVLERGLKAVAQ